MANPMKRHYPGRDRTLLFGMNPSFAAFLPSVSMSFPGPSQWRRAAATTALSAALLFTQPIPLQAAPPLPHPVLPSDPEHMLADEAWRLINEYYRDPGFNNVDWLREREKLFAAELPDRNTTYRTLRSSVSKLHDRYTRILKPSQMAALRKFDVSGVGLLLTTDASGALVVAADPADDTPAAAAGVKRGDVVLAVDGKDVAGVGAFEVAEWMQGADGSVMKIRFRDRGDTTLVRHFASNTAAVTRVATLDRPDGRMGYIRLKEFRASGRPEVARAISELQRDGAEWLVIDLRGNGGGVFEGALEIAGLFEGEGHTVARVKGRSGEGLQEVYRSRVVSGEGGHASSMDLAIVLDGRSASSSEVLAGGLRDECRAALVGDRSFGKGVIQGVFGLSDGGGVVVTVAEYRTPRGNQIDGVGLTPDLALQPKGTADWILKGIGIETVDESSITVTREQVRDVVRACQANEDAGGFA